jgi:hypothetical protein
VNAQYRITKKPRIEHVPGTEEWYQRKIWQEHSETEYRYTLPWELERSKAIAFLDYKWLGQELEGAPNNNTESLLLSLWDEQEKQKYPVKINYTPHWFQKPKSIGTQSFFTWT